MINIRGAKVCLRTFTREEYHQYWKSYISDPIMDPNSYFYDKKRVDENYDVITAKEAWYPRVGIFLQEGTPIGDLSFKRINYEKNQCELGIALANDNYKELGYGTESVKLAIDYVFNTLKLKYIYADTMGSNLTMQRIFNKFCFQFINREEHFYNMNDRWEDKMNYMLINPNATYL